jgi:hypothetical protein
MATGVSFSHYLEADIINHYLIGNASSVAFPAGGLYVALFTTAPTDSGGGVEVAGNGYTRMQAVWNSPTSNGINSGSYTDPTVNITFPVASASWGTIVAVGLFDAATAGNLWIYGNLAAAKTIGSGDQFVLSNSTQFLVD